MADPSQSRELPTASNHLKWAMPTPDHCVTTTNQGEIAGTRRVARKVKCDNWQKGQAAYREI